MVAQIPSRSRSASFAPLCLLLAACGSEEHSPVDSGAGEVPAASAPREGGSRPSARGAGKPAAREIGEEPYESAELGALHGEILFEGEVPERFLLGASQMKECQHHPEVDQRFNVVVVNDGRLAHAYVHILSGYDDTRVPAPPEVPVTLGQRGCMYVPRVLGLQLGQKLLVENGDPTTHNVHVFAKRNPGSNRSMGANQAAMEYRFEKPELPVDFKCDIHPWMGAEVFVEPHPWFAVSDEHGRFHIPAVPPGEYVVEVVHGTLGKTSGGVSVKAGRSQGIAFTLRE